MPRAKTKNVCTGDASKKIASRNQNKSQENFDTVNGQDNFEDVSVKKETPELPEEQPSPSKIDLSQFKFEKKPHIKIEFEKDSPVKEVGFLSK